MRNHLRRRGNIIEGILVPFASRADDAYNTYWDERTDFGLDVFQPHPVLHLHGLRGVRREGTISRIEVRPEGVWAEAELKPDSPLLALVDSGRAAWSSGSAPHLIEQDAETGYISKWIIVEGSIGDISEVAARRALTRADYKRAGVEVPALDEVYIRSMWTGENQMSEEKKVEVEAKTEQSVANPVEPDWAKSLRNSIDKLTEAVQTKPAAMQLPAKEAVSDPMKSEAPPIRVSSQYDNVSLLGMVFHHEANMALRQRNRSHQYTVTEEFMRALAYKAEKMWRDQQHVEDQYLFDGRNRLPVAPMRAIDREAYNAWNKYLPHLRADEAMLSTLSSYGDELVPNLMASALYYYIRLESRVLPLFTSFQMPSQPYDMPKITGSPVFWKGSEMADQANYGVHNSPTTTSQIGTGKVTFTAGKAEALTLYATELLEDAGVNFSQAAAQEYVRQMAHTIDWILINGDETATVANISYEGTDPSAVAGYNRALTLDGLRHMAHVDDSGNDSVAIATLADTSIITLQKLMGSRGIIGRDLQNLVCIVPPETAYLIDAFSEYETLDAVGDRATLLNGQVGFWRGVPVVVTEEMELTDTTGMIDDTSGDNTKGSALLVNKSGIMVGMKRQPTIEQAAVPGVDGNFIRGSFRLDVQQMEQGYVAYGYNTTV